ncbi:MAG: hypothetical protein DI629_12305 [Mesorhizobium amorphae]|nr:MAG: hypothetical protein DI629_12305 [Mesorhizobium amorphae]
MTMTTHEVLVKARELIATPENWTQQAYARAEDGFELGQGFDARACKWCALGAIEAVTGCEIDDGIAWEAQVVLNRFAGMAPDGFNDRHTHADVLSLYDRAIASTQEEAR